MILVHQPISPTPDDTAFVNWEPEKPDTSFFRSMMLYMDKEIGQLIDALKKNGIEKNTVIFFTADNGTAGVVGDYSEDDSIVSGGKHLTTEAGTHVPLIAYWPGKISPGTTCNDLVSFTDFLPTMAGIANIPPPADFGRLDGVSFYPRLIGAQGKPRHWIFSDYVQHPASDTLKRWAQTKTYKLYDTFRLQRINACFIILIKM
jgi:arylsulfatase A